MQALTVLPLSIEKTVQNADNRKTVADAAGKHPSVLEPKMDGWRTVWKIDASGKARFYTRGDNELTGKMPAVEAMLSASGLPAGTCLDGEVVAFENVNGMLVPRWGVVQSILAAGVAKAALQSGVLTLVLFDVLSVGDKDARPLPYEKRRAVLDAIIRQRIAITPEYDATKIMLIEQHEPTEDAHADLVAAGHEGSMVKWLDAPYRSGQRGAGWWKLKATDDVDAFVVGYKPGKDSFAGMIGAIIFGQYDADGAVVVRGSCSGMTMAERQRISKNPDAYVGRVLSFRHMGLQAPTKANPHGAFRHPQFKTWRPDRSAESVTVHG